MSLIGTLAKVAVGIAVAKGAQAILRGRSGAGPASAPASPQGGGLGDILEQLGRSQSGSVPGRQRQAPDRRGGSVLDEILGQLTGSKGGPPGRDATSGELGQIFKEFTSSRRDTDDGTDDPFAEADTRRTTREPGRRGGFGEVFNDSLRNGGEPDLSPTPQQEALAALMLRATIQAAKADGRLDDVERRRLMEMLGDVSEDEKRFVEKEMRRPVDVDDLVRQVPRGLEAQVYAMSVMGIDLDQREEAEYLHQLARGLGLDHANVNAIHDKLGVRRIYS